MLTEIRDYIKQRERVSVEDIALHFDITPELAAQQIRHWEAKGKVILLQTSHRCSGCKGCQGQSTQIYAWKESLSTK
jgi:DeoR/GlpR family transcriptional regulator of sugar metabolism